MSANVKKESRNQDGDSASFQICQQKSKKESRNQDGGSASFQIYQQKSKK